MIARTVFAGLLLLTFGMQQASAQKVRVEGRQLIIDGKPQPQLFGAEIQYFRLRGGPGRNIPRAKVLELWARALDAAVAAKMNTVSFYLPWDFHEYAEGKFDFDGTADEDGDGQPDYPSRDVKTFIKMIKERGIRHILVRPGPYINAEWGFLGFGAIPQWFHEKFPDSHMLSPRGNRTRLYSYQDPDFLNYTRKWFKKLYDEVLAPEIGPGRPIDFLQIDNETNFLWTTLYEHDFSPRNIDRYREYLKSRYATLSDLNFADGSNWRTWTEIQPPRQAGLNVHEDQEWYRFEDFSIFEYLKKIRGFWEELGVREPDVAFTLADSYNAAARGRLPNYNYDDAAGETGLMTVNLYPKTSETPAHPFLNNPFKADADVLGADSASEAYWGKGRHWIFGPEIQGGWWRGIDVGSAARRQTYLTVLGHGLKGLFVYYFNDGDNYGWDWPYRQIEPLYQKLKSTAPFANVAEDLLPNEFWNELQQLTDRSVMEGFDVRHVMSLRGHVDDEAKLYFDAPLDGDARPRDHYFELKEIGEKLIAPYGEWLGRAAPELDPVCILKDDTENVPNPIAGLDSVSMQSDWHAGLVGYLLQAGVTPRILHTNLKPGPSLRDCRVVFHQDNGLTRPRVVLALQKFLRHGGSVVNLMGDGLSRDLGTRVPSHAVPASARLARVGFGGEDFLVNPDVQFAYDLQGSRGCHALLSDHRGYWCGIDKGRVYQMGVDFYSAYNSNEYSTLTDSDARVQVLRYILKAAQVEPHLTLAGADKVAAFSETAPEESRRLITVKSGQSSSLDFRLKVRETDAKAVYEIRDIFSETSQKLSGAQLRGQGFQVHLNAYGSTVFDVQRVEKQLASAH